jgi:hypothetical protein
LASRVGGFFPDAPHIIRLQPHVQRPELRVDLLRRLRPDDRGGDAGLGERPGNRDLEERGAFLARDLGDPVGLGDVSGEGLALEALEAAALVVRRELVAGPVATGQQSFPERAMDDDAAAFDAALRQFLLASSGPEMELSVWTDIV